MQNNTNIPSESFSLQNAIFLEFNDVHVSAQRGKANINPTTLYRLDRKLYTKQKKTYENLTLLLFESPDESY